MDEIVDEHGQDHADRGLVPYGSDGFGYFADRPAKGSIVCWKTKIEPTKEDIANPKAKIKIFVSLRLIGGYVIIKSRDVLVNTKIVKCTYDMRCQILRTLDGWPLDAQIPNLQSVVAKINEQIVAYLNKL